MISAYLNNKSLGSRMYLSLSQIKSTEARYVVAYS